MTKLYQESWKELAIAYSSYKPPCIPSNQDVKHIEVYLKKILSNNKKPKIQILGCTGNYRKLFSKYNLSVDLVDITKAMFMYDPEFLKSFKRKEKFIQDNWLSMDLKDRYDLIVGDFTIHQFPLRKISKFVKNTKNHLKDDGLFITRIFHQPKKEITEDQVINIYKNKKPNFKNITELNWYYVYHFGLNKKTNKSHNRKGFLTMKRSGNKYPFLKKWAKIYEENFPTGVKYWTVLPDKSYDKVFSRSFKIIEKRFSKDYPDSEYCPTYVLKKK